MREILFRGKRIDNGEWVYGNLINVWLNPKYKFIEDEIGKHLIDPKTIGQYIDINDYNGDQIFEGDIVECYDKSADDPNWGLDKKHQGEIKYIGGCFVLYFGDCYLTYWANAEMINIVGNIHDK